jgi:hypothetical protein
MKKIFVLFLLIPFISQAQNSEELGLLKTYMIGSFNSAIQAEADTNYFDIRLDMVPIWKDSKNGFWLYVEQAINKEDSKPYRQRVYHVEEIEKGIFQSTIYKMDSAHWFTGLARIPKLGSKLKKENIEILPGCALTLKLIGETFIGETKKGACLNAWGKAKYATSEVEMAANQMISWDRGWDENHEHVWGAENGGYIFVKQ